MFAARNESVSRREKRSFSSLHFQTAQRDLRSPA